MPACRFTSKTVHRVVLVFLAGLAALSAVTGGAWASEAARVAQARQAVGVNVAGDGGGRGWRLLHSGGIRNARIHLPWSSVEPDRGSRHWYYTDKLIRRAASAHVRALVVADQAPRWLFPQAPSHELEDVPPVGHQQVAEYARYVQALVRRYGRNGRFWREHRHLPYLPVTAWQLWNEPNHAISWGGRVDAGKYAVLLRAGARAVRRADPHATVVLAGLTGNIRHFLRRLYQLGARRFFDVAAIHAYARSRLGVLGAVDRVRRLMTAERDAHTPVWITETGWATGGPPSPFRVSFRGQARRITSTVRMFLRLRAQTRVQRVYVFKLADNALPAGEADWWGPHTGLLSLSGTPKPAWWSLTRLTGGRARH